MRGIPLRLESVIRNLLDNALHFAGPAGQVTLRIDRRADAVELRVLDDGPGISAEDLPHVFERFYTRRRVGGTGLGLALARAIVEAHGGTLAVEPRTGACFVVRLPAG